MEARSRDSDDAETACPELQETGCCKLGDVVSSRSRRSLLPCNEISVRLRQTTFSGPAAIACVRSIVRPALSGCLLKMTILPRMLAEKLGGVAEDDLCVQITSKQQKKRQAGTARN